VESREGDEKEREEAHQHSSSKRKRRLERRRVIVLMNRFDPGGRASVSLPFGKTSSPFGDSPLCRQ
jgi:Ni/Co efflux regulator RcnB